MSFEIGYIFHPTVCVENLESADEWYTRVFGRESTVVPPLVGRDAIFTWINDVFLQSLTPNTEEGVLPRFIERYGARYHSIAWYAEGIDDLVDVFHERGIRMADMTGAPFSGGIPRTELTNGIGVMLTHPRDTPGMYEFMEPSREGDSVASRDPRLAPEWTIPAYSESDPLGIERGSYQVVVVRNLEEASRFFVDALRGQVISSGYDELLDGRSAYIWVGTVTGIQLVEPAAESPAGPDVELCGDIPYALGFKVRDIDKVRKHLKSVDVAIERADDTRILTTRSNASGVPYLFTTSLVAGDPRN